MVSRRIKSARNKSASAAAASGGLTHRFVHEHELVLFLFFVKCGVAQSVPTVVHVAVPECLGEKEPKKREASDTADSDPRDGT